MADQSWRILTVTLVTTMKCNESFSSAVCLANYSVSVLEIDREREEVVRERERRMEREVGGE